MYSRFLFRAAFVNPDKNLPHAAFFCCASFGGGGEGEEGVGQFLWNKMCALNIDHELLMPDFFPAKKVYFSDSTKKGKNKNML